MIFASIRDALRNWLRQSSRFHVREQRVDSIPRLIAIIDGFLDDDLSYPLEWDDFVSWTNADPVIEVERLRIASLERPFFSRNESDKRWATDTLVAWRNEVAVANGIAPRQAPA